MGRVEFIQQMFVECLLCARHCSRHWGHSSELNRQKIPALVELTL